MGKRGGIRRGKTIGVLNGFPGAAGAYRRIGYRDYGMVKVLELI